MTEEHVTPVAAPSTLCVVHHRHRDSQPLYLELHHAIPQAWQRVAVDRAWPVAGGRHVGAGDLFDPRTVALCRTSHGNVHFLLVRIMRSFAASPSMSVDLAVRVATKGRRANAREVAVARLAVDRWVEQGGNVAQLVAAGQYGAI